MPERRWTFVIVPHGTGSSRIVEVSQTVLKLAATLALVFVVAALLLGYAAVSRTVDLSRAAKLEQENRQLASELGAIHGKLDILSDTLQSIAARDTKIRLLANLEPNRPEVLAAGVGGPAAPAAPSSPTASRAAAIRLDIAGMIRRANLLASSFKEALDSLGAHRERLNALPSIMPTQGWLTSNFSSMREHPILHVARPHEGIDVTAPMGAPIEAPAAGRVKMAGWENGYGHVVVIDHGYGIETKFAHCSRLLVRQGQRVERGQRIALVGNTGLAVGPHLHYEVHVNGRPVDPLKYVLPETIVE
ncbi:MAG: M23 family metallopeptidase [Gemmatimonadota bacterium]